MYEIQLSKSARKVYLKLPSSTRALIYEKLLALAQSPMIQNNNVKKLQGIENAYRLRVGDFRVIYCLYHDKLVIEVINIGHRKEVYR
jgi:mRNA interferase RelE/StbE